MPIVRQGAKAYFAANLIAQVGALLRFAFLARLLGPHELGLAAMLILTAQFFQTVGDTGSDRFIVQDKDGDGPRMQGLIQFVLFGRGVLFALALVLFAGPIAALFKAPELKMSLMALSLVPLTGGLLHLDYLRAQRRLDFRPESTGIIVSEITALVAVIAAALVTHDASAVVYGLVLRSLVLTIASHVTASRPYRWSFPVEEGRRFSAFAAPLVLNGVLLFFGSQGDRVLIANGLGAEALGHYSAVLLLIFYPTSMLMRLLSGFFLPQLVRARDGGHYDEERDRLASRIVLATIAMLVGFALVGPIATPLLYGPAFVQPLHLFALIGALQTARLLRIWPTIVATSVGRSTIVLMNNIARLAGLPVAFIAGQYFQSLEAIVVGFYLGELAALACALTLLHLAKALDLKHDWSRVGAFLAWAAGVSALAWGVQTAHASYIAAGAALTGLGLALTVREWKTVVELMDWARRQVARRRGAG